MTDERMALQALFAKTPDADFLRQMIGFAAQRLMELEVASRSGAAYGEHSPERLVQRNGYLARRLEDAIHHLKDQPNIGVATQRAGFRRFVLGAFRYIVLYQPKASEIVIRAIRHGSRRRRGW